MNFIFSKLFSSATKTKRMCFHVPKIVHFLKVNVMGNMYGFCRGKKRMYGNRQSIFWLINISWFNLLNWLNTVIPFVRFSTHFWIFNLFSIRVKVALVAFTPIELIYIYIYYGYMRMHKDSFVAKSKYTQ